jgi:hypothetical protein
MFCSSACTTAGAPSAAAKLASSFKSAECA